MILCQNKIVAETRQLNLFLLRASAVWLAMMGVEAIHGTLRTIFVEPRIGSFIARQISVSAQRISSGGWALVCSGSRSRWRLSWARGGVMASC